MKQFLKKKRGIGPGSGKKDKILHVEDAH